MKNTPAESGRKGEKEMEQLNVRIPQVTDIQTAIRIYYAKTEIGNKDIRELFGSLGNHTIAKLKKAAKEQMDEDEVPNWNAKYVNTKSAYKIWGLDIEDLEKRFRKLKQLGVYPPPERSKQ